MYGEPITITITINRNIKKAYYYYFPDYYYYYSYYFYIYYYCWTKETQHKQITKSYSKTFISSMVSRTTTDHIITYNIIIKLSWKFCGLLLNNRESNSLLLANAAAYYYHYYYYWQCLTRLLLLLLLWNFERSITIAITFTPQSLHCYYY